MSVYDKVLNEEIPSAEGWYFTVSDNRRAHRYVNGHSVCGRWMVGELNPAPVYRPGLGRDDPRKTVNICEQCYDDWFTRGLQFMFGDENY